MKDRVVSATEFKAKCLAILDEIEQHGGPITITRRSRPVAVLGPAKGTAWKSPKDRFAEIASEAALLSNLRDPADRAIVATARVHRLGLVTSDQRIIESKLGRSSHSSSS